MFDIYIYIYIEICQLDIKKQWKNPKKGSWKLQDLAEKAETRMLEYSHKRYNNFSETEKQRLVEYKKRYYEMKKKEKKRKKNL